MQFQDLKISTKLGLAFGALILAFVISSTVVFVSLQSIDKAATSSQRSLILAGQTETMMGLILEQQGALRGYVLAGTRPSSRCTRQMPPSLTRR